MSRLLLGVVLLLCSLSSCDFMRARDLHAKFGHPINKKTDQIYVEEQQVDAFVPEEFNETTRLYYLCKTWGFAKYYHNNLNAKLAPVDSVLFKSIPKVIASSNKEEFNDVLLNEVVNAIQYAPLKGENPHPDVQLYSLINNDWFKDSLVLNATLGERLDEMFAKYSGNERQTAFRFARNKTSTGVVRECNEKKYSGIENESVRLLGLFRYWNRMNYFYPLKGMIKENWDKLLYEAIPEFRAANTAEAYHLAIHKLTCKLQDTHTAHSVSTDTTLFGFYYPGFQITSIDDKFVVNETMDTDIWNCGIKVGDIMLDIDGRNPQHWFDSLQGYISGSTPEKNIEIVCKLMLESEDSIANYTVLRDKDTLTFRAHNVNAMHPPKGLRERYLEKQDKQLYSWINDSVAYLNLKFATYDNFEENYEPLKSASTIIIDLRNYPDNLASGKFVDAFVPPGSTFAKVTYADTDFPGMLRVTNSSNTIGNEDCFKGNIIILVSEKTRSYSEYITMMFQANSKTIVVGSPTSGSDGNSSRFYFPGKVHSYYTGIGIYYPDMTPTQCEGVRIDHIVRPTFNSIVNNQDLVKEKAIEIATKRI